MRRPSRLCALGASAILFQPLTPYGRGVYRGSEAAVIAARFSLAIECEINPVARVVLVHLILAEPVIAELNRHVSVHLITGKQPQTEIIRHSAPDFAIFSA